MSDDRLHPPRIKWLVEPTFDDDGVQRSAGIDQFGREHPDPVPHSPPVGLSVGEDPTYKAIQRLLIQHRKEFGLAVEEEGFETEAEANDFLIPDDLFPPGNEPWEDLFLFPVPEEGPSPTLAGGAPNGENRAPEDATRQPSISPDQRVSGDLVSDPSMVRRVETPTVVAADAQRGSSAGSPSASSEGTPRTPGPRS